MLQQLAQPWLLPWLALPAQHSAGVSPAMVLVSTAATFPCKAALQCKCRTETLVAFKRVLNLEVRKWSPDVLRMGMRVHRYVWACSHTATAPPAPSLSGCH